MHFSPPRAVEPMHIHTNIRNKKTISSPHGQDSPNNSSKKFLQKSEAIVKGHIRQSFKGKQSTHPKELNKTLNKNPTRTHSVFYKRPIYQENFTRIKPANSLSHPVVVSNTSWSPTTTTPTQYMPNPWKSQWTGAPKNLHENPQPTLRTRASAENSLPRQRVPNSLAKNHDWKRKTLPTRSTPPAQKKLSRACNPDVQK